jgi:hypothetical protein
MANTIKIKRRPASGAAGKPSSLLNGEVAFNENDNILYYGYGSGVGGVASTIEQIGGSGYFAHRGGINASGVWPIGVTGNAATVTDGVYTTGTQTINGLKTFGNTTTFNSGISAVAINTSSNSVGYFAVFDNNPNSSTQTLKSVSKDQILDDIGAATSGLDITAGSGLVGGGTLSQNRRFDIGQGDGISVSADSISVDSTVVRTSGDQTINGIKTFGSTLKVNYINPISAEEDPLVLNNGAIQILNGLEGYITLEYNSGADQSINFYNSNTLNNTLSIVADQVKILSTNSSSSGTYFPVFTSNPNTSAEVVSSRTASQIKGDIGLSNVTNDAQIKKLASTSGGYVPTWNGTTGDALNIGYSVETTLTGGTGALPRADAVKTYVDNMIVSGIATNDAMIFKGTIDCSTNPNYPAADRGWTYKVSVAGKIGGASGPVVEVNDTIICGTDGTAAGTHASVGSNWNILQTNIVDASILVTGPANATSGNFAMFDGTTGKIIKDAGFAASTVGQNLVSLTNPSATTFIKVNSNNTVSTESASTFRTSLGANTVGSNIFTLTDPSAISFIRINADNTVTARSASELKTDLSLNNVENTALSTWAGSTNITTLGTIATGTWSATTIAVNKGGTGQTSYTDGQLLIGNTTSNTLTKSTLTAGTSVDITNGNGSITIGHADTSTLTGAQGSNGIASITVDGLGHVTAVTTATYLTAGTVCAAIVDCALDGGSF